MLRSHRASILWWFAFLIYGAPVFAATDAPLPPLQPAPQPIKPPHIALLLPTGSDAFGKAADAVREGFAEASKKHVGPPLTIRLYPVTEDPRQLAAAYREAAGAGARIVVGPLTRNGVTAIVTAINPLPVPTLALNVADGLAANPPNLYTLSLQIESEARQIAQVALKDGRRKALTITDPSPLGRRMRDAFVDEFERGGGFRIADYPYATDAGTLERLRQAAATGAVDMVFLALDAGRARAVRPQVSTLPAYGTSQIDPGTNAANFIDLDDLRFVDMPWLLQPDHPAVMVYSRPGPRGPDEIERLRALGIDAFRIAETLYEGKRLAELDGVTGRLSLAPDGRIRRVLPVAIINGGQVSVLPDPPK
jgi:outer membrane PBP1 activator LpoA protein